MVAYLLARTMRGHGLPCRLGGGHYLDDPDATTGAYAHPVVFGLVGVLACAEPRWRSSGLSWCSARCGPSDSGSSRSRDVADVRRSLDSPHMTGKMFFGIATEWKLKSEHSHRAGTGQRPPNSRHCSWMNTRSQTRWRGEKDELVVPPQDVPAYVERMFSEPNRTSLTVGLCFPGRLARTKEADRLFAADMP